MRDDLLFSLRQFLANLHHNTWQASTTAMFFASAFIAVNEIALGLWFAGTGAAMTALGFGAGWLVERMRMNAAPKDAARTVQARPPAPALHGSALKTVKPENRPDLPPSPAATFPERVQITEASALSQQVH